MWLHRQRARRPVPWSLRLSAIFPALQMQALHTLLETDAAEREGRDACLLPGWSRHGDMNEAGNGRVHGMVKGRRIYYLMTEIRPSSTYAAQTAQHRG